MSSTPKGLKDVGAGYTQKHCRVLFTIRAARASLQCNDELMMLKFSSAGTALGQKNSAYSEKQRHWYR